MASSQLLVAQERLNQLRIAVEREKDTDVPWEVERDTAVSITQLPTHLGWGSTAVAQSLRQTEQQKAKQRCQDTAVARLQQQLQKIHPFIEQSTMKTKQQLAYVTHYPSLGIAALQKGDVPAYRVWLLCRYLDDAGRGALDVGSFKAHLTETTSPLRLFSWKRLRQILSAGNGRFWHYQQGAEQLWLVGVARVAQALDVSKLTGKRVQLPIKEVTAGIGPFKAQLYAAWHSGRNADKPISRKVQRQLTSIPERTQRVYGRIAKIKTVKNIAIGRRVSPTALEEEAWQRGNAVFEYIDYAGNFGEGNGRYLAWQLPNQYQGPHQQAPIGRQRKINKVLQQQPPLKDLVQIGAQGNREKVFDRLYHANGATAVKAFDHTPETYWPTKKKRATQFWAVLQKDRF